MNRREALQAVAFMGISASAVGATKGGILSQPTTYCAPHPKVNRLFPVGDVRRYGASACNEDNTRAFEAAVADIPENGTVVISDGIYPMSRVWTIGRSNVNIHIDESATLEFNGSLSTLDPIGKYNNTIGAVIVIGPNLVTQANGSLAWDTPLSNIHVFGGGTLQTHINDPLQTHGVGINLFGVTHVSNWSIRGADNSKRLKILNATRKGIAIEHAANDGLLKWLTINNSSLQAVGAVAVAGIENKVDGIRFEDSSITTAGRRIVGVDAQSENGHGVQIAYSGQIIRNINIARVAIADCAGAGISLSHVAQSTINDVDISNCGTQTDCSISNVGCDAYNGGVVFFRCEDTVVSALRVISPGGRSVYLAECKGHIFFTDCSFDHSASSQGTRWAVEVFKNTAGFRPVFQACHATGPWQTNYMLLQEGKVVAIGNTADGAPISVADITQWWETTPTEALVFDG